MKKILLIILIFIVLFNYLEAATYETCNSGEVGNNAGQTDARFSLNGGACDINPRDITFVAGDEIIITDGNDLTIASNWQIGVDITFRVRSNLYFNNGKLDLTENSQLILEEGANLACIDDAGNETECPNNDQINIGETKFKGSDIDDADDTPRPTTVNKDGALPIELKSFIASKSNQNINLDWVTAKEENFSHFEIERSVDQNNWEPIGFVQGLGESNSDVNYNFTDRNAPFGVIYYRLKAVDIDATFEYSPVVKVEVGFEGKLAVSPNPVKDASKLKIQVPSEFREDLAYVGLFDLSGVKVQEFRNFNTDGSLHINQKLKSGMYILKVNHNGLQENIRVIVQ
ncbi:T9SS type A sorting domain-containing protein [Marivirga sp.]|uniref:T9SS type A sorting domain-containing protein n=1 Tax=Marivirga sp. TaxID=2018662 RepID=UPI003DA78D96